MPIPPIAALEIGTSNVRALIGEAREDGYLTITGVGQQRSAGVRKGEVVDFDHALAGVRSTLQLAEEQSNTSIKTVHLVLTGAHIRSDVHTGTAHVLSEDREITQKEMDDAQESARKITLPTDREVLHSINQHYYIDGGPGVANPLGMEGTPLELDMLIIHGAAKLLRTTIRVARTVPIDVQDVAFSGLCASLAVLTPEQKASGVAVIDLGGGTTDYLVYAEQKMARAGTIGIGGDHVTNDLALGLKIPTAQAERLKMQNGDAMIRPATRNHTVSLPAEGGFQGRSVRLAELQTIVNARMDELLRLVRAEIEKNGLLHHLGAGVVLTGGGSLLTGVVELAERVFNLPCAIGRPRAVGGLAEVAGGPEFAATVGMLRYAMVTAPRGGGPVSLMEFFGRLLGRGGSA